jgi:hypothetical protein
MARSGQNNGKIGASARKRWIAQTIAPGHVPLVLRAKRLYMVCVDISAD